MGKCASLFMAFLFSLIHVAMYSQNGTCILNRDANSSGTSTISASRGITPFTVDRLDSRHQFLYLYSEIMNVMGPSFSGTKLTSIAFNVVDMIPTNPVQPEQYTIRIGHYAGINLPGRHNMPLPDNDDMPIYATFSSLNITQLGWYELPLDVDFIWNGTSNILIEICKSNSQASTPNFRVSAVSFNGTDYRTRALHTLINNHPQTSGCDMFSTGNGSSPTSVSNNTTSLTDANRRVRPDIKLQFACSGTPTPGNAFLLTEGNYCNAESVLISVQNGDRSSRLAYQWQYSADNINFLNLNAVIHPDANEETLFVGRAETNLFYRRLTSCPESGVGTFSTSVEVQGINTWNGSEWSLGVPQSNEPVKINATIDLSLFSGVLEACTLFVENGTLWVNEDQKIIIKDKLIVSPSAEVIFKDKSSLIQELDVTVNQNVGTIKYRRNSTPMRLLDYTYWSSPVEGQTPHSFSPATPLNRIYLWNSSTQTWNGGISNSVMTPGRGYIIRAPNGFPSSGEGQIFNGEFIGKPNNGDIYFSIVPKNPNPMGPIHWNLLGNPYPSAIDADLFLLTNQAHLEGTLYYWTHNSSPSGSYPGNHAFNYSVNDYATYNLTGSVGVGSNVNNDPNDPLYTTNTTDPGKYIASGQGFMVPGGDLPGNVIFKNSMRVSGNNDVFFRNSTESERSRIWLEVFHEGGSFKQLLVGFLNQATDGLDWGFDGKMLEGSSTNIYTLVEGQKLTIDGRSAFAPSKIVPIVFQTNHSGNFHFSMYQFDGLFSQQDVYLYDTYTQVFHNLKEGNYSFNSLAGTFVDRFEIRFNVTLGVHPELEEPLKVSAILNNNFLQVLSLQHPIEQIQVFDVSGRKVYSQEVHGSERFEHNFTLSLHTVYVVKVYTQDGSITSFKLINQ